MMHHNIFARVTLACLMMGMLLAQSAQAFSSEAIRNEEETVYASEIQHSPEPFTALGMTWEEQENEDSGSGHDELMVRFHEIRGGNEGAWTEWVLLQHDVDGDNENERKKEAFIATNLADAFQYKIMADGEDGEHYANSDWQPSITNVDYTFIHAPGDERTVTAATPIQQFTVASNDTVYASTPTMNTSFLAGTGDTTQKALRVISRSEWGADESLRVYTGDENEAELVKLEDDFYEKYADELKISRTVETNDAGEPLVWPLAYAENMSKFVVHHTATTKNLDNPKQAIRDIYYWHTITRGWGDIGYNFIVDQQGNVYEGRYGGDRVVGAHAGPGNVGSVGIAVLGNYEESTVPADVTSSLSTLIKAKATKYDIDPMGSSMFRGEMMPNVFGHRDIMSTTCPGKNLYSILPTIRALSKNAFTATTIDRRRPGQNEEYDYELVSNSGMLQMKGGTKSVMTLEIENTGTTTWGPSTYLALSETNATRQYLLFQASTMRSQDLGIKVSPGQTATFQIPLTAAHVDGITTFEIFPMIDGKVKLEKYIIFPAEIEAAHYDYELISVELPGEFFQPGEEGEIIITLKNTSEVAWKNSGMNRVRLGTENPREHVSRILQEPSDRLADMEEAIVEPGEEATFIVKVRAPEREGYYREYFAPVVEGAIWMGHKESYIEFYVGDPSAVKTGTENKRASASPQHIVATLEPEGQETFVIELTNNGQQDWTRSGEGAFEAEVVTSPLLRGVTVRLKESQVLPGETGQMEIFVTAPRRTGIYRAVIMPEVNGRDILIRPIPLHLYVTRGADQLIVQESGIFGGFTAQATQDATASEVVGATAASAEEEVAVEMSAIPPGEPDGASADAAMQSAAQAGNIRIGLSFEGEPIISSQGPFQLMEDGEVVADLAKDDRAAVTFTDNTYHVEILYAASDGFSSNNALQTFTLQQSPRFEPTTSSSIMRIDNYEHRPSWAPELNDNEYHGSLEVHQYNGALKVINELPLESYMYGLAEIDPKQHIEKIKAILVAARSYAYYYMTRDEKFPGAPFHLSDDPADSQYYLGYGFEKRSPTGVSAVKATDGQVVTYNDEVIKTPYFSASNGRTLSAEEVWGWTHTPYLQSVDDPGCAGEAQRGHGVGMSGCGSLYFAEQGQTYFQILKYYFQGVQVQNVADL